MSNNSTWKSQAPSNLALPSSPESNDHFKQQGFRSQPLGKSSSSPFSSPVQLLTRERLLSPVDPGFLDGASSLARFGLDIGGTLCKVVCFEPCVEYVRDSSRPTPSKIKQTVTSNNSAGLAKGTTVHNENAVGLVDKIQDEEVSRILTPKDFDSNEKSKNGCSGNALNLSSSVENSRAEHVTEGLDQLTFTNFNTSPKYSAVHAESNRRAELEKQCSNRTADEALENWKCGCGTSGIHLPDHDKEDKTRMSRGEVSPGSEDDMSSRRQAKKIWVSSHDPVHLPGRGTLYFKCFETWRMEEFLNLTKQYRLVTGGRVIGATGGGARKFGNQFLDIAGLQLQRADELKSLVRGIDFLVRHAQQESFKYPAGSYQGGTIQRPWESPENSSDDGSEISSEDEMPLTSSTGEAELKPSTPVGLASEVGSQETWNERTNKLKGSSLKGPVLARLDSGVWMGSNEPLHPYLVVNIGSGVSILRVESADTFKRVGGTSLGGSTFLGLTRALTGCQSFEEAISLAMQGDSTLVDMLVGDIYGGDYTEMGLAATTVASSFGKLVQPLKDTESPQPQHLAKAALLMVTNNIGSIAMLHAHNTGVNSVMFTGSFLHNNKLAMRLLSVAMEFWSKGKIKAVFLRHEGHAGAMGALLSQLESSNPLDALLLI